MHTNIFAVTAAMAATASAFSCHGNYFSFFNRAGPMTYQQIDPALFPGKQSPHLHSFDGGNAVSSSSDFDTQMGSSCTTARIKPDKSLYWRPTLFWNGNNTGFHRVPEQAAKIYYKFGDDDSWANVTEFPEDFNMMAGDPFKRSDGDNPAGIRWACHQPDGRDDKIFTNGFPSGFTSCKYGFASEVTFPSCWNGEKLNPSKPNDHMAYPTGSGVGTEKCPTTHRVARFPTIFIEFWYDISSFDKTYSASSTPWVLSNGDPTGYGMHADFLNGWEKGVLGKATAETGGCNCGCGCGDDQMKECFGAENVNESSDSNWDQCAADTSVATALFDKLPGCNPIQSGPARASVASGAGCSATAVASATSAAGSAVSSIASAAASAVSSAVNISISIPNKGYAGDAYPTADAASSSPAEASSTPAAAESYSAPYPFPSGNSTVAPTATGQYSYSIHKSHGHNHSKFHHSKSTASPATPSDVSGDDADAEAASSCTASAPVTVTYTPTVTVSAKALAAAVDSTTVTTLTSYVTVTATATGY